MTEQRYLHEKARVSRSLPEAIGAAAAVVLSLAALGLAAPLGAVDPPHWAHPTEIKSLSVDCRSCHVGHSAPGLSLTNAAGNVALCQSCHTGPTLPISNSDVAVPHYSGTSHAFDVPAINPEAGTQLPLDSEMQIRVMEENIVCSTCHNQHSSDPGAGDIGDSRVDDPTKVVSAGGDGGVASGGTYTGSTGLWFRVEIKVAGNTTGAEFCYSTSDGNTWSACSANKTAGAGILLEQGVTVSFVVDTGPNFAVGEQWEFYASRPFLRNDLDSGANNPAGTENFCRDCHRDWVAAHDDNPGGPRYYDGSYNSHPVGVTLNANGAGYDRTAPLDANGNLQGGGSEDGNASNNLVLDSGGRLQCLTCHAVHFVDSNSVTEDRP